MKIEYLIIILMLALIALASSMSYDDEVLAAENYRGNVCAGVWPDFDHREPDCTVDEVSGERYYP